MTRGFSTWLNILRAGAALVVVLSHWAYPRFSGGDWVWIRDLNLGSDAVVIFFVLSGYVIAFAAFERDGTAGRFLFNRATRVMSVALPALVLGWGMDRLGAALDPAAYDGWWYAPLPLWEQVLRGISFSNEWLGQGVRLGSNGPFWSLSYEVAYYALFACAVWLRGAGRVAALALGAMIAGLNVILLAPAWLLGVWVYRAGPARRGMIWAAVPVGVYAAGLVAGVPEILKGISYQTLGAQSYSALRFSDEFLWNAVIGLLTAAHLRGMAAVLASRSLARLAPVAAWSAGGSFSIYLVHYPLMQLLSVWIDGARVLLVVTVLGCFAFAAAFERPLPSFRSLARRCIPTFKFHLPRCSAISPPRG